MVDVTRFLTRWLYLSNLARDIADIQTLPHIPIQCPQHQYQSGLHHAQPPQSRHSLQQRAIPPPPPPPPPPSVHHVSHTDAYQASSLRPKYFSSTPTGFSTSALHQHHLEQQWRDHCLRGVLSYAPGTQRLYALDALRFELVQKLAKELRIMDETLERFALLCRRREEGKYPDQKGEQGNGDRLMDADAEILDGFRDATSVGGGTHSTETKSKVDADEDAFLFVSTNSTGVISHGSSDQLDAVEDTIPSDEQVDVARRALVDIRDCLPQLVSAGLKSPQAFHPELVDPIQKLRRLILTRCLQDPNWGIELCWLLEADVGRAWKTLFEHRQQTGKRLIVVLPAEKAAVIATIGTEKREAFDLLQDAEQATAYGYTMPTEYHHHHHRYDQGVPADYFDPDIEPTSPRLSASLSLRRCSHFGDTMHFIDRLTQISMDLRRVPELQRDGWLKECLCEMNRRLRRRMVTKGDVSLDVDDNRGPHDWPQLSDLSADSIQYSVHFPLLPKRVNWPNGEGNGSTRGDEAENPKGGAMRVLNIVTSESRMLSSRERCPFLVHLEVAETGVEGSDSRLYGSGIGGVGKTLTESLGTGPQCQQDRSRNVQQTESSPYQVPSDLYAGIKVGQLSGNLGLSQNPQSGNAPKIRGGFQSDEGLYYPPDGADYLYSNPYDIVRQQEYEQLHQELRPYHEYDTPQPLDHRPPVSSGEALLEKVFGLPWDAKCSQIRQTSHFGKVKGWRLASFIMKAGEDIRREALVMQIISKLNMWFATDIPEPYRPLLRPYTIMCVGGEAGLIECLSDAKSVDEVKKRSDGFVSLRDYFERAYGMQESQRPDGSGPQNPSATLERETVIVSFEEAQDNFLRSLVGYSLLCYVLQIKDRHNANILLDRDGRIVHIDFGYVLGDTPKMGKVPLFSERAPFKLSAEFWEVLGGWNFNEGGLGVRFCKMFERAFETAASHVDEIVGLTEAAMLNLSRNPDNARALAGGIRSRLRMRGAPGSVEQKTFIMDMVNTALTSWGTSTYDWLQKNMNGYQ